MLPEGRQRRISPALDDVSKTPSYPKVNAIEALVFCESAANVKTLFDMLKEHMNEWKESYKCDLAEYSEYSPLMLAAHFAKDVVRDDLFYLYCKYFDVLVSEHNSSGASFAQHVAPWLVTNSTISTIGQLKKTVRHSV